MLRAAASTESKEPAGARDYQQLSSPLHSSTLAVVRFITACSTRKPVITSVYSPFASKRCKHER